LKSIPGKQLKIYYTAFTVFLCLFPTALFAMPDAQVQSVQMPAWLLRDKLRTPLAAGVKLNNNDQLITGKNARVLIQAADGSAVKLGENATLELSNLSQSRNQQTLFTALLNVTKGAFRFTTSSLAKLNPRDIVIKVSNATIGIRGTDVWGKDGEDRGIVCLIEGKISVAGADKSEFTMEQPLTFYEMPKLQVAKPVAPVDPEQLKKWALETEIIQSQGATVYGGKWKVVLLTEDNQAAALASYDAWRNQGYAVRLVPIAKGTSENKFEIRIDQLPTKSEALSLAKLLKGQLGALSPSVVH
jgi:hypothetical protein